MGFKRWVEQEKVFRWIPFWPVESLFLFLLAPGFILLIYISLLRWRTTFGPWWQASFGGFRNFTHVFRDPEFLYSIERSLAFAGIAVALEMLIGFILAFLVYKQIRGQKFYITIFLIPMMIVPVVVGYNFSMILIDTGPLNQILAWLGLGPLAASLTGMEFPIRWISAYRSAQAAVILADVWQWTPLCFLIFVSGLSALPPEPIRAAQVMGASRWQLFRHIQLPLLKPIIVIAFVVRSMEALKIFDQPMLLTLGGPGNATQTVAIFLWRRVWEFNKIAYGAAAALLLLILFSFIIFFSIRLLLRERARLEEEAGPRP